MFEKIGLGGFLTFNINPAVSNMYRARAAMSSFAARANQIPGSMNAVSSSLNRASSAFATFKRNATIAKGFGQISSAMGGLGLAMAPLSIGMGLSIRDAMNFEKALSGVDAVILGTKQELNELGGFAKTLTGSFNAIQIVEGMEDMSRAGATAKDIFAGIPGVIAAASAEGLDLSKTAAIVGKTAAVMGLGWEDSGRVANVLARASADTQSSIISLAEAFKYGGGASHNAGIDFETTAAIMSRVHDAGLNASTAGTGMQQVLAKLAKPTKDGAELLDKWGIKMTHNSDGSLDFINVLEQIAPHMENFGTDLEKNAAQSALFGERGSRFSSAFMILQKKAAEEGAAVAKSMGADFFNLSEEQQKIILRGERSIQSLAQKYKSASQGIGVASEMAKRKLDNLAGAFTVLKNQAMLANIEIFTPMLKPLATVTRHFTEFWGTVLVGLTEFRAAGDDISKQWEAMDKTFEQGGSTALNVVMGINDAIHDMGEAFDWAEDKFNSLTGRISKTFGGNGIRALTRFAMMFGVIGGVMSPILIGLSGIALVMKMGIIPLFSGLATIVTALATSITLPMVALAGAATIAFATIRREGESFGDTVSRAFWNIAGAGMTLYEEVLQPIFEGFKGGFLPGLSGLGDQLNQTANAVKNMFSTIFGQMDAMNVEWKEVGKTIGSAFISGLSIALELIQIVAEDIDWLLQKLNKLDILKYAPPALLYQGASAIADNVGKSDAEKDKEWNEKKENDKKRGQDIVDHFFELFPESFRAKFDSSMQSQEDTVNGNKTLQSGDNNSSGPLSSIMSAVGLMGKASANDNGAVDENTPIGPGYSQKIPTSASTSAPEVKNKTRDLTNKETRYDEFISEAAKANQLPEALIRAVIKQESNFNPNAKSGVGAQGLMQMMPGTAADMGVKDPFDPRQNIMGGSKYLKKLSDRWGGDMTKTIASYNAGPGNVQKYGGTPPFKETQRYVKGVTRNFENYSAMGSSSDALPEKQSVSSPAPAGWLPLPEGGGNMSRTTESLNESIQKNSEALTSRTPDDYTEGPAKRFFSQLTREEQKKMSLADRIVARGQEMESKFYPKKDDSKEEMDLMKITSELSESVKEKERQSQTVQNTINVKPSDVNTTIKVNIDGKQIAQAVQSHREEVAERAGFRNTPWERRLGFDHAASRLAR